MRILNTLFALITMLALGACTTPYYGYSAEQWAAFSEQEQAVIKAEYEQILKIREDQKHADILEKRTQQIIKRGASGK